MTNPNLRLFTGIAASEEINSRLDEMVARLKPLARIRWSPAANFHITTKFIGAWRQDRLEELKAVLAGVTGIGRLTIAIRGLSFFPNPRRPRIFLTHVEGGEGLENLAARTQEACAGVGIKVEKKEYSPHLTLARIDSPKGLKSLGEAVEKDTSHEFGSFEASVFHLYLSQPGRGGSVYTSLAEFPL